MRLFLRIAKYISLLLPRTCGAEKLTGDASYVGSPVY